MSVYFTSDLHLGHAKIAEHRGYGTTEHHDTAIYGALCALPRGSQLWILGDISAGSRGAETYALAMLGAIANEGVELHLIAGNHDSCHPMHRDAHKHQRRFLDVFWTVQPFARRRIGAEPVLLSHFPYKGDHTPQDRATQYRLRDEGMWLLHGHTHAPDRLSGGRMGPDGRWWTGHRQIHVGWDAWQRPVHLDELDELIAGGAS
ncbi:metallophosphatase [Rhodococcus daqingensis]|uniref:Metallophosphatase n=1 Tax=Rhodococcus daqingensis TaxID=2479363 RepID=A0ABW2S3M6_9NOCA